MPYIILAGVFESVLIGSPLYLHQIQQLHHLIAVFFVFQKREPNFPIAAFVENFFDRIRAVVLHAPQKIRIVSLDFGTNADSLRCYLVDDVQLILPFSAPQGITR